MVQFLLVLLLLQQPSFKLAEGLQRKIEVIKARQAAPGGKIRREIAEVSGVELESYVLFLLQQKKIPAKLDSVDVQLAPADVATDTQITLGANTTGTYIVDRIIQGTHRLFVKGKFTGSAGKGKFDLESVRVDRLPVPVFLAQLVFNKLVKPMMPQADIREPFQLPFGIDSVAIVPGKVIVIY
jgi:hypothetical protein